ncbi:DUF6734 family protein [Dyadobacter aurulentus]|uniref:DUF6734 family protein n=1 Tax=Dyadobacter sp. UC 10 TaxID=2605428 RepID=UPI0011F21AC2|nr:DUF6734 family protein [Dyadobacter sp. UC 10]KAA0988756.1 hypothetical protein FXO21_00545 [Dyadobacter sp. UC 10]
MNAVQTFWAPELPADQIRGGWLDARFHFMGWALSASLLHQHFPALVLHTDQTGKHILADLLELPYSEVHLTQEGLGDLYSKEWWVLRKISSYAQPDAPFLHVDGDAFLWNGLPDTLSGKPVIAQNDQSGFPCYEIAIKQFTEAGIPLPHFFNGQAGPYKAVNMGITGGTNHTFFKAYVEEVKSFFNQYLSNPIPGMAHYGYLNTLIEEAFFRHYADYCQQPVTELIPVRQDGGYGALANCMDESFGLTHLIGTNKKDIYYCKQVEFQLKKRFPKTFQKVVRLIEKSWNKTTAFTFPDNPIFIESNLMIRQTDPEVTVDNKNWRSLETRYRKAGKNELSAIIRFEYEKHALFRDLLSKSEELRQRQEESYAALNQNLRLSPDTILTVNERIPVMHFSYPGKTGTYYLATVYDFGFGYHHIAHRPLDDLAIFIIASSKDPITIAALTKLLTDKTQKSVAPDQREKLLRKLDLKIKELLFLGLLEFPIEPETLPARHKAKEAAGV